MKIGIITHNYPSSSSDRQNAGIFVYDIAHALEKAGHKVCVLAPGTDKQTEKDNVLVTKFSWLGNGKKLGELKIFNPLDLFSFINMLFSGCRKTEQFYGSGKLDFIIGMWTVPAGLFALWAKLRNNTPYVLWSLGSDTYVYAKYPVLGNMIKMALSRANFLVADGIDLAKQTEMLAKQQCLFLPSASKLSHKSKVSPILSGPLKFIFLGRMEPVKGPDILIKAISKIKDLDFELHCLGSGSLLPLLKDEVKKQGLEKKVFFYGNVSDSEVIYSKLSSSDWLVIPSRSDSIPLVFSEGMKAHLPVVVSEVGDMLELVQRYKVGLSFPKEDFNKLAGILRELIKKGRKEKFGYKTETKVVAKMFDVDTSAKRLVVLMKENIK